MSTELTDLQLLHELEPLLRRHGISGDTRYVECAVFHFS